MVGMETNANCGIGIPGGGFAAAMGDGVGGMTAGDCGTGEGGMKAGDSGTIDGDSGMTMGGGTTNTGSGLGRICSSGGTKFCG